MRTDLFRAPTRVLISSWARRPWTAAAYLVAEIAAGWLTWLFASTFVLLPVWAAVWAGAERRLVALAGLPPIRSRATGWTGRVRETAFALVLAVVAVLGTVAAGMLYAGARITLVEPFRAQAGAGGGSSASPAGRCLVLLIGLIGACLLPLLAVMTASGLAQLSTALLSPRPEQLAEQVDALVDRAVETEDRLILERRLMEQRLHDGAQLHLSAAGLRLGLLELRLAGLEGPSGAEARETLGELREQIDAAADAVREAAHGLTPRTLAEQGLRAALEELAAGLPIPTRVTWAGGEGTPSPSSEIAENLYLIASEAITNAIRHSGCSRIEVRVECIGADNGAVVLTVRDDGRGGAAPTGQGILGMAARSRRLGGTFEAVSPDGGPTTITVRIPTGEQR